MAAASSASTLASERQTRAAEQSGLSDWLGSPPKEPTKDHLTSLDRLIMDAADASKEKEEEEKATVDPYQELEGGNSGSSGAAAAFTNAQLEQTDQVRGKMHAQEAPPPPPPPPPPLQSTTAGNGCEDVEEHRSQTGLQLVGELAPPSLQWKYLLSDEQRRCFIGYLPRTLSKDVCASFFSKATDCTSWMQPENPNGSKMPRKTAWMVGPHCDCHYCYGRFFVAPVPYPPWMVSLMEWIMPCCGINDSSQWPNSCNLNLYEGGDMSVGWHADDEQLFQGKFRDCKIISLSLGAARSFELRANWSSSDDATLNLMLGDGDLCTMEGMVQKYFQHRVPRENLKGARINLTWRWILKHSTRCPAARARPPLAREQQ